MSRSGWFLSLRLPIVPLLFFLVVPYMSLLVLVVVCFVVG